MKNIAISAAFAASVLSAMQLFAADKVEKTVANAAKGASLDERIERKFGGFVNRPGKGKIWVYDCQGRIAWDVLSKRAAFLQENLFGYEVKIGKAKAPQPGGLPTRPKDANAAIFIVDDPALPMTLVAPECQWGVLNVAALAVDKPSAENLAIRFNKAFSRVCACTFGAWLTGSTILKTVSSVEELDKLPNEPIPFDALQKMTTNLRTLGMEPVVRTSYKKACREGWAPAPTNEWQKAIWDKARQLPSKPITIKYDPKIDK